MLALLLVHQPVYGAMHNVPCTMCQCTMCHAPCALHVCIPWPESRAGHRARPQAARLRASEGRWRSRVNTRDQEAGSNCVWVPTCPAHHTAAHGPPWSQAWEACGWALQGHTGAQTCAGWSEQKSRALQTIAWAVWQQENGGTALAPLVVCMYSCVAVCASR